MGLGAPGALSSFFAARRLLTEALWLLGSASLAALMLYLLHEEWQPWTALAAGMLGGVLLRAILHSNFARFPRYLRINFEIGVALLGVLIASWSSLALYQVPYWILKWRAALAMPAVAALLGLGLAALRSQQLRFERSVAEFRDRENALREETLRSQLRALQAQINPHFLFNALNALAELTRADPAAAEEFVQDLAFLLRYSLRSSAEARVTLAQEYEAVDRYLRVEERRLGERLHVERVLAPGLGEIAVPGLIVQPLVENAVRHAVAPRIEGGQLRIEALLDGEQLLLAVEDDGPGLPDEIARFFVEGRAQSASPSYLGADDSPRGSGGAGGGLANVKQRLELAYRGRAAMSYSRGEMGGCRLELRLPLSSLEERT